MTCTCDVGGGVGVGRFGRPRTRLCGECSVMRAEDLELCRGFPSSAYVDFALGTSPLPVLGHPSVFPAMGLCEEAGEVMGKIKKTIRDGGGDFDKTREAIRLELGDVLWYLTATADALGYTLDDIMIGNATKLAGRRKRGTVLGSGDDR